MKKKFQYDGPDFPEYLDDSIALSTLYVEDLYIGHFTSFRNFVLPSKIMGVTFLINCN